MSSDLQWAQGGPRSRRYDDVYFSEADGLAESRAVFLQGCGLPEAWAGRPRFTIAELGLGTGLNIAALLELWRRTRAEGARLSIFSVEAHLISRDEAARALEGWRPALGGAAEALLAVWPAPRRGFHRLDLPGYAATLDLYVGDVGEALERWSGLADAWFLDGFAPSKNPDMWREEVLCRVARLSAPGAQLASFTVAGHVRRALSDAGFQVDKRSGFGRKRERLEARLGPAPPPCSRPGRAVVIGAGIGGAALARAFDRAGVACTVIDAAAPGAGASGNPAALVTPRFDAGFGPAAELHAQAFARAVDLYRREVARAVIAEGALQLGRTERDGARFDRLAGWDGYPPRGLEPCGPDRTAQALDEAPGPLALHIAEALTLDPGPVLQAWLGAAARLNATVARLERRDGLWTCMDADGEIVAEAEIVCVAAGPQAGELVEGLGLRPVRGQVDYTFEPVACGPAAAWGAYAIPLPDGGVLFGASHVRGDSGSDTRAAETASNLQALAGGRPALAARICALPPGRLSARASVRAATADHLPLAGAVQDGLHVLSGFGGRGFTLAPLLAEHVAALATASPSPLPVDLARRLRPLRFCENQGGR